MHPNLQNLLTPERKARLEEIARRHYIARLYAFGSVCSDEFREESDVDILYLFEDVDPMLKVTHFLDLAEDLEALFERKVDLVSEKHLRKPRFIASVEERKTLIYAA